MLAEERMEAIVKLVEEKRSVTVQQLVEQFCSSESTIRRDLSALHAEGRLVKVFGGALAMEGAYSAKDDDVELRADWNKEEKSIVARYAASLIGPEDFVYLDAGTTTGCMIRFLTEKRAVFVTNAVLHARALAHNGFQVFLIGGELKASTEAVVGNEALINLEKYNFTIGFFGANGVSRHNGFTTPDANEAIVKQKAMERCRRRYILCDASKFGCTSPVTFASFTSAQVITNRLNDEGYRDCGNLLEVDA